MELSFLREWKKKRKKRLQPDNKNYPIIIHERGFYKFQEKGNDGKMITGSEILKRVNEGTIQITDFDIKRLNPNSYNLRIGDKIGYYPMNEYCEYAYSDFERKHPIYYLDTMRKNTMKYVPIPEDGLVITPGLLYLANTMETVTCGDLIPSLSGRSSMARLGVEIHRTAGFGDIGASMKWTLEITVIHPVKIYPGQELCQIYFEIPQGDTDIKYIGKYQYADGIVPSKSYLDAVKEFGKSQYDLD